MGGEQGEGTGQEARARSETSGEGARARTQTGSRTSVQNEMLGRMRRRATHVDVYLMSGIRLDGVIESFDQYSLVLRKGRTKQLVYKHAVSTVRPHSGDRRGAEAPQGGGEGGA